MRVAEDLAKSDRYCRISLLLACRAVLCRCCVSVLAAKKENCKPQSSFYSAQSCAGPQKNEDAVVGVGRLNFLVLINRSLLKLKK